MGPGKSKDEVPAREAAERQKPAGEERGTSQREAVDPREEEGWSQPESSAQKTPPLPEGGKKRGDPSEQRGDPSER